MVLADPMEDVVTRLGTEFQICAIKLEANVEYPGTGLSPKSRERTHMRQIESSVLVCIQLGP